MYHISYNIQYYVTHIVLWKVGIWWLGCLPFPDAFVSALSP